MKEYLVGKVDDVPEGEAIGVKAGRRVIAVVRIDRDFYAFHNTCPHKGASLCAGRVDKRRKALCCPWHNWAWSLETGRLDANPDEQIRTYDVKVVDDEVILCV